MPSSQFRDLLLSRRSELLGFLRRHAPQAVLRYESPEDLLQGTLTLALEGFAKLEERNDDSTRAWLFRIARNHLADRTRYWMALKRRSGKVLRFEISRSESATDMSAWDPKASQTSPSQCAMRREQLVTAVKAMNLLMERDRNLVTWTAHKIPLSEQASKLGLG
ncbi:MAG: hypothetical protein COA70_02525 [Planctomycetota bacterium]|nr:MAG: hypothetical protein COA70_02525 [Planctomycetota bacterium]